jgi:hypothetical protein
MPTTQEARDFHDNLQVQYIRQLYTSGHDTGKHQRHGLTEIQNIQRKRWELKTMECSPTTMMYPAGQNRRQTAKTVASSIVASPRCQDGGDAAQKSLSLHRRAPRVGTVVACSGE